MIVFDALYKFLAVGCIYQRLNFFVKKLFFTIVKKYNFDFELEPDCLLDTMATISVRGNRLKST